MLKEEAKSVASRACWTLMRHKEKQKERSKKTKSVASRACWHVPGQSKEKASESPQDS